MPDAFLEHWLEEVLATPGATGIAELEDARRMLLDDALRASPVLRASTGSVIDVGSGGGTPGIPLAFSYPEREFTLLDADRRKCDFLTRITAGLSNVTVLWGRAEEQPTDGYGVALAKALAKPPVAAELCLPLVRVGGLAVLWVGDSVERDRVDAVARRLGGLIDDDRAGLLVLRKVEPTPAGFPRRAGMAKKRPLA